MLDASGLDQTDASYDPARRTRPILSADHLTVGYGGAAAVRDVSFDLWPGQILALLGPNGAGKTTTLLAVGGVLPYRGTVSWNGGPAAGSLVARARAGMSVVFERRGLFPSLTVADHLAIAPGNRAIATDLFPELARLGSRKAGMLSGGEQRMLALGLALTSEPRCLVVDELSLGLAPLIVKRIAETLRSVADSGVAMLIVDQYVDQLLDVADRGIVLRRGTVALADSADQLKLRTAEIQDLYL